MARQEIILGTPPQGLGGDPPRTASMKINAMTDELYAATGALVKVASATDTTPGRLLTTGAGGILGSASPPASDCNAIRAGGKYGCAGTPNAPIPDIGTLEVTAHTADWVSQTFRAILPITRVFERSWYGGTTWSPWIEVYTAGNALVDPASGGLMSSTVVNGFQVTKYANGDMKIQGSGPVIHVEASTWVTKTVSIPSGFSGAVLPVPTVSIAPYSTNDCYGITTCYMNSSIEVLFAVRNGPVAQDCATWISVWGRWK